MKRFVLPLSVMLGILILSFIIGGVPKPKDIEWQQYTWTYAGRDGGVVKYASQYGGEFTVDRLSGGKFTLGYQENEYRVSIEKSLIEITFPDGREIDATMFFFDDVVYFPFSDELAAADLRILDLAAKVDRVFQPKGGYIALAVIITALGAVNYGFPLACAKFALLFRAWMVKDPEPTEEYIMLTKIFGGILMLGGWIFLLYTIWN